ncbi:MAG: methyltransferase domain-containing protein [Rhodospirillaceae bacterium]
MTSSAPATFDAAASARVDRIYQNPDIVAQRVFVRQNLALKPGERVMDIGAGPGLLTLEMATEVGSEGKVIALDPSQSMRAIAEHRCRNCPWVSVVDGDATALPAEDASLDALVATQVYEYVPDMPKALREAFRVLKPGGRLLALDTDWHSAVVNTSNQDRMSEVLSTWRSHFVHPDLPGRFPKLSRTAGFDVVFTGGMAVVNTAMTKDTFAGDVLFNMPRHAERQGGLSPETCAAWLQELKDLDASGDFFFSVTRFVCLAVKPD